MNPRLHILLPVHNRRATTVRFVETLNSQTWSAFHLVLIDDGSTDGTADAVREVRPDAEVVTGSGAWWWAGSLEQGCLHLARNGIADDDVLLLINDDVEIAPNFLEEALSEFEPLHDTLLLARQRDAATGAEIDYGGGVHADLRRLRFTAAREPNEINCLPTRGLLLRWRDVRRIGGFRPAQLPHYLSDYEFTLRAARTGLALRVARTAAVRVQNERTGRSLANLFEAHRGARYRLLFSPRFKDNPITWSRFVSLAAPPARRPFLWTKIWLHFFVVALSCALEPVSSQAGGPVHSGARIRQRARDLARRIVPAALRTRVRRWRAWQWFRGDYATWTAARAASGGYEADAILGRVLAATLKVRAGEAAFERDSVLFHDPEPDAPLLSALQEICRIVGNDLRVLDFGGALGSTYWRHRTYLPKNAIAAWDVVEQPAFVAAGRQFLATEPLAFFDTPREAGAVRAHHLLLCSGTLQYLESPAATLASWRELRVRYLLLNNVPLHTAGPTRIRVQHVPPSIYAASYPVRFFNRAEFLGWLEPDYEVVREFASEAVWPVDNGMYPSTGLLLRRKDAGADAGLGGKSGAAT